MSKKKPETNVQAEIIGEVIADIAEGKQNNIPSDVLINTPLEFTAELDDGTIEKIVYRYELLSPFQICEARNILMYEHELEASPLQTHVKNKMGGVYTLEMEALQCLLIALNEDGTPDRYDEDRWELQKLRIRKALSRMNPADYLRLQRVKKNFGKEYNIPTTERTRAFRQLAETVGMGYSAMAHLRTSTEEEQQS